MAHFVHIVKGYTGEQEAGDGRQLFGLGVSNTNRESMGIGHHCCHVVDVWVWMCGCTGKRETGELNTHHVVTQTGWMDEATISAINKAITTSVVYIHCDYYYDHHHHQHLDKDTWINVNYELFFFPNTIITQLANVVIIISKAHKPSLLSVNPFLI